MAFFTGREWVFQQDLVPAEKAKTTQEWLRRNLLAFTSAENWLSWSADVVILDKKLWAVLEDMACQKCQRPGEPEEIPCEGSDRDPPRDGACGDSSGRSVPRLASRHRVAILSDIIVNENLKLFKINYLA